MKTYIFVIAVALMIAGICPHASAQFDPADPETDKLVQTCLETEGVNMLPDSDVICYNSAIYPEQFLQLNEFPTASRIIITSPGGNVATARIMSKILDQRGEPAVIAGPCMSACAMVLLPGLDSIHIHRTAHIAVHGITMMKYRTWWGWLRDGEIPSSMDLMTAQLGYDFDFAMHNSGKSQMKAHLKGQHVEQAFINVISEQMQSDALTYKCRVDPKDYWGILDASHIRQYLGDRVTRMEAFAQSWGDPNNQAYKSVTTPISDQTYIFDNHLDKATCDEA